MLAYIHNLAIFWALAYLEPEAYLKSCEALTRHIQNPVIGHYSAIFRHKIWIFEMIFDHNGCMKKKSDQPKIRYFCHASLIKHYWGLHNSQIRTTNSLSISLSEVLLKTLSEYLKISWNVKINQVTTPYILHIHKTN